MKIRHILIPTDLSEEGVRPYAPVAEFAADVGASITLLHVVQDLRIAAHGAPLAPPQSPPDLPREVEKAREALERQRALLPADVEVRTDVVTNEKVVRGITDYAESNDVDLIALSTHGRTGFRHLALGSVAESVLRHSGVPVLSFPRQKGKS